MILYFMNHNISYTCKSSLIFIQGWNCSYSILTSLINFSCSLFQYFLVFLHRTFITRILHLYPSLCIFPLPFPVLLQLLPPYFTLFPTHPLLLLTNSSSSLSSHIPISVLLHHLILMPSSLLNVLAASY